MKKLIPILVLTLILFSFTAFAQALCFPPYPVFGKYSSNLASAQVKITVHDTRVSPTKDIVITEDINSQGEYQTDLGNIDNCYFNGMTGEIVACTGSSECTTSFTVSGTKFRKDFAFTFVPDSGGSGGSGGGSSGGGGGYTTPGGSAVIPFGCQQWTECVGGKQTQSCSLSNGVTSKESRDCLVPIIAPTPVPIVTPVPQPVPTPTPVPIPQPTPAPTPVIPKGSHAVEIGAGIVVVLGAGAYAWYRRYLKSKGKVKADQYAQKKAK